jgi:hypothetical protein
MCNFSICLFSSLVKLSSSLCEEKDYMPYKVDGHADLEVNFESYKVLCILDDCRQLLDHPEKLTEIHKTL